MAEKKISLRVSPGDPHVAYVRLPGHPGEGVRGCVARQVRLLDLMPHTGPDLYLDLDAEGRLIGIEILG